MFLKNRNILSNLTLKFSITKIKKVEIINSVVPTLPSKETINFVLSIPFPPKVFQKIGIFHQNCLELKKWDVNTGIHINPQRLCLIYFLIDIR